MNWRNVFGLKDPDGGVVQQPVPFADDPAPRIRHASIAYATAANQPAPKPITCWCQNCGLEMQLSPLSRTYMPCPKCDSTMAKAHTRPANYGGADGMSCNPCATLEGCKTRRTDILTAHYMRIGGVDADPGFSVARLGSIGDFLDAKRKPNHSPGYMKLKNGETVPWDDKYEMEDLAELPCVTTARMQERERCAGIADARFYATDSTLWSACASEISIEIRAGE